MDNATTYALLAALLAPAVWHDLRERRIPNLLTLAGLVAGIAAATFFSGLAGTLDALAAAGIAFAIGLPFWLLGWLGAGDVKLVTGVGAIVGKALVLPMLAAVGISGFLLACAALLQRRQLAATWERFSASFGLSVASRRTVYVEPGADERDVRLPYAIAIATGAFFSVWYFG